MNKELKAARESIHSTLAPFLPANMMALLVNATEAAFGPLIEELRERGRKSIAVTQIGQTAYRVDAVVNFLGQRCGVNITTEDVQRYIDNGITVRISRNK